jgi:hypothetical protein
MHRINRKRTLGLALIVAAAAAVFIGLSASTHASSIATVPTTKHVGATNDSVAVSGSTGLSKSGMNWHSYYLKGGPCLRCLYDHPYEF